MRKNNYRILREVRKSRYDSKVSTAHGGRHLSTIEPRTILNPINQAKYVSKADKKDRSDYSQHSRCSDGSKSCSLNEMGLEGRIEVDTVSSLNELEKQIRWLW